MLLDAEALGLPSTVRNAPQVSILLARLVSAPKSWFWLLCADLYPALAAFALPWSTTAVSVLLAVWLIVLLPTIGLRAFLTSLKRPESFLPIAFFALALLGMLWTDDSWAVRIQGLHPVFKLLAIPLLLYHFERSRRSSWVFIAFFASCALVMAWSWVIYLEPGLSSAATDTIGIPARNYIDQSQEFSLCLFAAAPGLLALIAENRRMPALCLVGLMLGFYCNMMFVVIARTAFLYFPVLLVIFAVRYCRPKAMQFLVAAAVVQALVWCASPNLRNRVDHSVQNYRLSRNSDIATSDGERLVYWRASVRSIVAAPVFGHGTGSTKQVFDREAAGKTGEWANSIRNPHNQTLYVAMQWGMLGCIVLYAMWYFHLMLFLERSLAAWIGLIVVVQNFVSSLVNSHLFDFDEGWIYVIGVGVAGAMAAKAREKASQKVSANAEAGGTPKLVGRLRTGGVQNIGDAPARVASGGSLRHYKS
jgi:O-antigen ligase